MSLVAHRYTANGKPTKNRSYVHFAMAKYGVDNFVFEVIYQSLDRDHTLGVMEQHFIDEYQSLTPNGYNLNRGGNSAPMGIVKPRNPGKRGPVSEESRERIRRANQGKHIGRVHTAEARENMSKCRLGIPLSESHRANIAKASSKTYQITFDDGRQEIVIGLLEYAKTTGYSHNMLADMARGRKKRHRDITSVIKLSTSHPR